MQVCIAVYLSANASLPHQRALIPKGRVLKKNDLSSDRDLCLRLVCNPCTQIPIVSASSDTMPDSWNIMLDLDFLSTKTRKKRITFRWHKVFSAFRSTADPFYAKFKHVIGFKFPSSILVRTLDTRITIKLSSLPYGVIHDSKQKILCCIAIR